MNSNMALINLRCISELLSWGERNNHRRFGSHWRDPFCCNKTSRMFPG
ncbi:uncharacterized protein J3R85_005172 [Psidium guajava]|nr:uncharacterized protein J3R85_005172 [Psidium guajava]